MLSALPREQRCVTNMSQAMAEPLIGESESTAATRVKRVEHINALHIPSDFIAFRPGPGEHNRLVADRPL